MNEEEERFFCAGRWKHARIFAIVHLIFEVIGFFMLIASGLFIYLDAKGPVLAIIGESVAATGRPAVLERPQLIWRIEKSLILLQLPNPFLRV